MSSTLKKLIIGSQEYDVVDTEARADITSLEGNVTTLQSDVSSLSDQIANLEGGAPTAVSTVAQMVDTTQVYLYTGTESGYVKGAWYYYNGTAWTYGGIYGLPAEVYVDGTSLVINTMMTNGNEVSY